MFNKENFCHVASNNRNEQKAGIFVYKTTDDLQTVLQSGYFNEKIIDINLHDLIIHEQTNATDKTIVERNLLCVVERTLENVGTQLIQSNWEKTVDETIDTIIDDIEALDDKFVHKTGDTMTGTLRFVYEQNGSGAQIGTFVNGGLVIHPIINNQQALGGIWITSNAIVPHMPSSSTIGRSGDKWNIVYTTKINNGGNLEVPAVSGTLATKADVDLAANSGDQLTNKGVWYAKMYAATVAPSAEDGTNYADFSQVDTGGNPIIVLYERQNGAWVETDIIVPPADYNGYVTVTSKIWDIVEQSGQQGGKVLWSHNTKTFTPYPQIISFENAALTGNSTVQMPQTPTANSIVNKNYVDTEIANALIGTFLGDVYPVGALYIGTQSTCPMAALIPNSVWELVTANKALWTGDGTNANTTIEASAPNIKGTFQADNSNGVSTTGAFTATRISKSHGWEGNGFYGIYTLDASTSSSVYKDDATTIQPPAYVVNVWRRTA